MEPPRVFIGSTVRMECGSLRIQGLESGEIGIERRRAQIALMCGTSAARCGGNIAPQYIAGILSCLIIVGCTEKASAQSHPSVSQPELRQMRPSNNL